MVALPGHRIAPSPPTVASNIADRFPASHTSAKRNFQFRGLIAYHTSPTGPMHVIVVLQAPLYRSNNLDIACNRLTSANQSGRTRSHCDYITQKIVTYKSHARLTAKFYPV